MKYYRVKEDYLCFKKDQILDNGYFVINFKCIKYLSTNNPIYFKDYPDYFEKVWKCKECGEFIKGDEYYFEISLCKKCHLKINKDDKKIDVVNNVSNSFKQEIKKLKRFNDNNIYDIKKKINELIDVVNELKRGDE